MAEPGTRSVTFQFPLHDLSDVSRWREMRDANPSFPPFRSQIPPIRPESRTAMISGAIQGLLGRRERRCDLPANPQSSAKTFVCCGCIACQGLPTPS